MTTSYHTHNRYCDGEGQIEEVVQAAIEAGVAEVGISSHAPLPFATDWTMPPDSLTDYANEVHELQRRYAGRIRVLLGAEIDFIPDSRVIAFQERTILPLSFDYFIGSVHFLGGGYPPRTFDGSQGEFRQLLRDDYGGEIDAMAADYYARVRQMVTLPHIRIVGHLDLIKRWNASRIFFQGDEPWYVASVEETLAMIAASGTIVELNTAGWLKRLGDPYPAPWILARCRDVGIPIALNSDSHTPGEVTRDFDRGRTLLAELGITPVDLDKRPASTG
jgi:histidinol-phosphatase (PHP family)